MLSNPVNILLVDDQHAEMTVFKELAKYEGIRVEVVDSGVAASTSLVRHCPDYVFVDQYLNNQMTGLDWIRNLRTSPFHFVPVIMFTSSREELVLKAAIESKVIDFLQKPVDPMRLKNIFESLRARSCREPTYQVKCVNENPVLKDDEGRHYKVMKASETAMVLRHPHRIKYGEIIHLELNSGAMAEYIVTQSIEQMVGLVESHFVWAPGERCKSQENMDKVRKEIRKSIAYWRLLEQQPPLGSRNSDITQLFFGEMG